MTPGPNERDVANAIKQLRTHLHESMQQFSNRLGVTLSTIARYESTNPPKGPILLRIADIAHTAGREDLRQVFEQAEESYTASRLSPVARAIRQLRSTLGATQRELAQMAGVALSTVARAETRTLPDEQVLAKFAVVAREHKLGDIAETLIRAQTPDVFLTPEQRQRKELKNLLLTSMDLIEPADLNAVHAILSQAILSIRDRILSLPLPVDAVPPEPVSVEDLTQQKQIRSKALAMLQVSGSFEGLTADEIEEANTLCAVAWLLENDVSLEELNDTLVKLVHRTVIQRGSPLNAVELRALGAVGARASKPSDLEKVLAELKHQVEHTLATSRTKNLSLSDLIKETERRLSLTPEQFAELLSVTDEQLAEYEAGTAVPELRVLLTLKSTIPRPELPSGHDPHLTVHAVTTGAAYTREVGPVDVAILSRLVDLAHKESANNTGDRKQARPQEDF